MTNCEVKNEVNYAEDWVIPSDEEVGFSTSVSLPTCPICNKRFTTRFELGLHLEREHDILEEEVKEKEKKNDRR